MAIGSDSGFGSFSRYTGNMYKTRIRVSEASAGIWRSCVRIGFGFRVVTEEGGVEYPYDRIRASEASAGVWR